SLNVSGLPAGATASFSPAPITGGSGISILSVSTTSSTPAGSYSLVITGTDGNGNFIRSATVALTVYSGPALNVSTASLNWGNVTAYGSLVFKVVTLTAVNGAVTINSTTINTATAGDFRISSNSCPSSSASLASGTSCSIVL